MGILKDIPVRFINQNQLLRFLSIQGILVVETSSHQTLITCLEPQHRYAPTCARMLGMGKRVTFMDP